MNRTIQLPSLKLLAYSTAVLVLAVAISAYFFADVQTAKGIGYGSRNLANQGFAACGTTSTLLAATSSGSAVARSFVNTGGSGVYLNYGLPAVGSNGIYLTAGGGSLTMDGTYEYLFTGAVYCIASSTTNVSWLESK